VEVRVSLVSRLEKKSIGEVPDGKTTMFEVRFWRLESEIVKLDLTSLKLWVWKVESE